jgi:hypothetical protein
MRRRDFIWENESMKRALPRSDLAGYNENNPAGMDFRKKNPQNLKPIEPAGLMVESKPNGSSFCQEKNEREPHLFGIEGICGRRVAMAGVVGVELDERRCAGAGGGCGEAVGGG